MTLDVRLFPHVVRPVGQMWWNTSTQSFESWILNEQHRRGWGGDLRFSVLKSFHRSWLHSEPIEIWMNKIHQGFYCFKYPGIIPLSEPKAHPVIVTLTSSALSTHLHNFFLTRPFPLVFRFMVLIWVITSKGSLSSVCLCCASSFQPLSETLGFSSCLFQAPPPEEALSDWSAGPLCCDWSTASSANRKCRPPLSL